MYRDIYCANAKQAQNRLLRWWLALERHTSVKMIPSLKINSMTAPYKKKYIFTKTNINKYKALRCNLQRKSQY